MRIYTIHTILLFVCLLMSAGCDTPPESTEITWKTEVKEKNVTPAVEGNTPSEPEKSRDMATVKSETAQYKIEKTAAVVEMNRDMETIEEDKISKKAPVDANTQ